MDCRSYCGAGQAKSCKGWHSLLDRIRWFPSGFLQRVQMAWLSFHCKRRTANSKILRANVGQIVAVKDSQSHRDQYS
jgi:hypothetical protein